jgi:hypothetical protein
MEITVVLTPDDMRKINRLIEEFLDMNTPEEAVPRLLRAIPEEVFVQLLRDAGMKTRSPILVSEFPKAFFEKPEFPDSKPLLKKPDPTGFQAFLIEVLSKNPDLREVIEKVLYPKPDPFQVSGIEPFNGDYSATTKPTATYSDDKDKLMPS